MPRKVEIQTLPDPERQTVLKDLYVETGQNFRHFLAWRRFLFAGYFAVIAGLGAALDWETTGNRYMKFAAFLAAALLSIFFWVLDRRNRKLVRNASNAGAGLEDMLGIEKAGSYSIYKAESGTKEPSKDKDTKVRLTHSGILCWFYWLACAGFVAAAVSVFVFDNVDCETAGWDFPM